jgi:hypothetical protein
MRSDLFLATCFNLAPGRSAVSIRLPHVKKTDIGNKKLGQYIGQFLPFGMQIDPIDRRASRPNG